MRWRGSAGWPRPRGPEARRSVRARLLTAAGVVALAVVLAGACSEEESGSPDQLCALVGDGRAFTGLFEQGFDPTDTERALAQLQAAAVDLAELREAAPSEVRDAIDDEVAYVDALLEVVEDVDPDDPAAVVDAVNALDGERDAAEVAALELQAFQTEHCGTTTSI
jgi:hypothetical protein